MIFCSQQNLRYLTKWTEMQEMIMFFKFIISLHILLSLLQSNFLYCPLNVLQFHLYPLLWRKMLLYNLSGVYFYNGTIFSVCNSAYQCTFWLFCLTECSSSTTLLQLKCAVPRICEMLNVIIKSWLRTNDKHYTVFKVWMTSSSLHTVGELK